MINLTVHTVLVEVVQEVRLLTLVNTENRRALSNEILFFPGESFSSHSASLLATATSHVNIPSLDQLKLSSAEHRQHLSPGKHVLRVEEGPDDPHQLHGCTHVSCGSNSAFERLSIRPRPSFRVL